MRCEPIRCRPAGRGPGGGEPAGATLSADRTPPLTPQLPRGEVAAGPSVERPRGNPRPRAASSLRAGPADGGGCPQAVPAGGGGGVVRREDAVQVVLQQLLVHDAWAAGGREGTCQSRRQLCGPRGQERPSGCPAPWQLVEELATGTWALDAPASPPLPQLGEPLPAPRLTCGPGFLVRGQPVALAGERQVSPLGCHPSCPWAASVLGLSQGRGCLHGASQSPPLPPALGGRQAWEPARPGGRTPSRINAGQREAEGGGRVGPRVRGHHHVPGSVQGPPEQGQMGVCRTDLGK